MDGSTVSPRRGAGALPALRFAALAACVFVYLLGFRHALVDDAYITLTYARSLREAGVWGLYPPEVANTSTSMLNTVLTAAAFTLGASPVAALGLGAV